MKDSFIIQLEPSTLPASEVESRVFKALEILLNLNNVNVYEPKNSKSV